MTILFALNLVNRRGEPEFLKLTSMASSRESSLINIEIAMHTQRWQFAASSAFDKVAYKHFVANVTRPPFDSVALFSFDESIALQIVCIGLEYYISVVANPLDLEARDRLGVFDSGPRRIVSFFDAHSDIKKSLRQCESGSET